MPVKIFFCYAHEDEALLNILKRHLSPLRRQGLIDVWNDRDISAGSEWEQEISQHLNSAQIILLLVSPDFIDSDYCYSTEMQRAMERHEQKEAQVIPIILRSVYWQGAPFGKLQVLPTDAKPVKIWQDQDEAFFDVAEGIRKAIRTLPAQPNKEQSPVSPSQKSLLDRSTSSNRSLPPKEMFTLPSQVSFPPVKNTVQDQSTQGMFITTPPSQSSQIMQFQETKWRIRKQRVVTMILGASLLCILISLMFFSIARLVSSAGISGGSFIYLVFMLILVEVTLLFFGTVFGPWVGLITGGVGAFVGVYFTIISHTLDNMSGGNFFQALFSNTFSVLLGIALVGLAGFIAGLARLITQGHYNTVGAIATAESFSILGILIFYSPLYILAEFSTHNVDVAIIIYFIPGLILFPFLLAIYNAVTRHWNRA